MRRSRQPASRAGQNGAQARRAKRRRQEEERSTGTSRRGTESPVGERTRRLERSEREADVDRRRAGRRSADCCLRSEDGAGPDPPPAGGAGVGARSPGAPQSFAGRVGTLDDGPTTPGQRKSPAEAGLSSAPGRNRTFNLRIKSPLLCQLSYKGVGADESSDAACGRRPRTSARRGRRRAAPVAPPAAPPAACGLGLLERRLDARASGPSGRARPRVSAARSPLRVWPARVGQGGELRVVAEAGLARGRR